MQLLLQIDTTDYAGWKARWDDATEDRAGFGLTQLQLWRGADAPGTVFALLEVNNPAAAKEWLLKAEAFGGATTSHFLKTV